MSDNRTISVRFGDNPDDVIMITVGASFMDSLPDGTVVASQEVRNFLEKSLRTYAEDPLGRELLIKYRDNYSDIPVNAVGHIHFGAQSNFPSVADIDDVSGLFSPSTADIFVFANDQEVSAILDSPPDAALDVFGAVGVYRNFYRILSEELIHAVTPDDISVEEEVLVKIISDAVASRVVTQLLQQDVHPQANTWSITVEDWIVQQVLEGDGIERFYDQYGTPTDPAAFQQFLDGLDALDTDILAYLRQYNLITTDIPAIDDSCITPLRDMTSLDQLAQYVSAAVVDDITPSSGYCAVQPDAAPQRQSP